MYTLRELNNDRRIEVSNEFIRVNGTSMVSIVGHGNVIIARDQTSISAQGNGNTIFLYEEARLGINSQHNDLHLFDRASAVLGSEADQINATLYGEEAVVLHAHRVPRLRETVTRRILTRYPEITDAGYIRAYATSRRINEFYHTPLEALAHADAQNTNVLLYLIKKKNVSASGLTSIETYSVEDVPHREILPGDAIEHQHGGYVEIVRPDLGPDEYEED